MPETLILRHTIPLDDLAAAAPLQVLLAAVTAMFDAAERAAADAGRRLQADAWELVAEGVDPDDGGPAQLNLTLRGAGHLIHVTEERFIGQRWYAVPEDLVGGWACANVDLPASQIDVGNADHRVGVETWGERTARHVAELHNAWLANEKGLDATFMRRLIAFSQRAFGPHERTAELLDHLRKELGEVEADPHDLDEWADVVLLALDGAWRHGGRPQEILDRVVAKMAKNEGRTWPDWRTAPEGKAIEHDRSAEVGAFVRRHPMGPISDVIEGL